MENTHAFKTEDGKVSATFKDFLTYGEATSIRNTQVALATKELSGTELDKFNLELIKATTTEIEYNGKNNLEEVVQSMPSYEMVELSIEANSVLSGDYIKKKMVRK